MPSLTTTGKGLHGMGERRDNSSGVERAHCIWGRERGNMVIEMGTKLKGHNS